MFTFNSLTSVSEERAVFKQLEKETDPTIYNFIVKVVKLFFLNIITKAEAFELLNQLPFEEELEYLKDIIDAR